MTLNADPDETEGAKQPSAADNYDQSCIAALALRLHETDSQRLEIEVPANSEVDLSSEGVTVVNGKLRFTTLSDRNRIVAAAKFNALGDTALDASVLFAEAARLWRHEIGHDDTACGRLLAMAHPRRDVLSMAIAEISRTSDVFRLLSLLQKVLPLLDQLDWASLIGISEAQYERTKGDGAAGTFFSSVQKWLAAHPGSGAELSTLLLRDPSEPLGPLLSAALLAWGGEAPPGVAARVVELSARSEAPFAAVTGYVAERMLENSDLPKDAVAPLEALVLEWLDGQTPELRRRGVSAATSVLHVRRTFDVALRALAEAGDADTLGHLAFALSLNIDVFLDAGTFSNWLAFCVRLPVSSAGAIRFLDSTLAPLLGPQSSHRDAVLQFLQDWIAAQPRGDRAGRSFTQLFDDCAGRVAEDRELLAQVVTSWFMADSMSMPEAAASLISGLGHGGSVSFDVEKPNAVGFDSALLDGATTADLQFLARRLIGYVFVADDLLSLALSLLRVRDAQSRVHPLLQSLLGDEIGYDYPATTVKRLGVAIEAELDVNAKVLLERIRDQLQSYLRQLDALPQLKELEVPLTVRRAFRKARAKQMEDGMSEARAMSVFASLATHVHLKAGVSSFQYQNDEFTGPMTLQSLSYSIEMPRRETLDPVGNAYRLRSCRLAKKEQR